MLLHGPLYLPIAPKKCFRVTSPIHILFIMSFVVGTYGHPQVAVNSPLCLFANLGFKANS